MPFWPLGVISPYSCVSNVKFPELRLSEEEALYVSGNVSHMESLKASQMLVQNREKPSYISSLLSHPNLCCPCLLLTLPVGLHFLPDWTDRLRRSAHQYHHFLLEQHTHKRKKHLLVWRAKLYKSLCHNNHKKVIKVQLAALEERAETVLADLC